MLFKSHLSFVILVTSTAGYVTEEFVRKQDFSVFSGQKLPCECASHLSTHGFNRQISTFKLSDEGLPINYFYQTS